MITFSISDATIAYLLYLLLFFSAISIIILAYLVSITKSNTETIMKITSKLTCDLAANHSIVSTKISGEQLLSVLSKYKKGFGGIVSPLNTSCHCGKIKELNKQCDCLQIECQGGKGFIKRDIESGNDLSNV